MNNGIFLVNVWVFVGLILAIVLPKIIDPKGSYSVRISLIIAIIGAVGYALEFFFFIATSNSGILAPIIGCLICVYFIYLGGRNVPFKTVTGVQSLVNNDFVGRKNAGSLNWVDPILERTTISTDGKTNTAADLQELVIEIPETPEMQTEKRGITVKVRDTIFTLKLMENSLHQAFRIEGGLVTIRKRINSFVLGFYLRKVGTLDPKNLDTDKENIIEHIATELASEVNLFCERNNFPYETEGEVTIADIVLTSEYYTALGKKEFASLQVDADNVTAEGLTLRLQKMGKELLPSGTEAEQIHEAKVALGIVKQSEEKKTFGLTKETTMGIADGIIGVLNTLKK